MLFVRGEIYVSYFCGHREIYDGNKVERWLYDTCRLLMLAGEKVFYLGGYGAFDFMAARVLTRLKSDYQDLRRILVLAYPDKKIDLSRYDESVYPPLEYVPRRLAILKRNEWMVDESDILVSYVLRDWGGAAKTLAYAEEKDKEIIRYTE